MKSILFVLAIFVITPAHAADMQLACTLTSEGSILSEQVLNVILNKKEISFVADFFGRAENVNGKFLGVAKDGSLMYDGSDLMDQVDQSDYGYIFVAPALLKTGKGELATSVRQLGDSDGSWWITDSYSCTQK